MTVLASSPRFARSRRVVLAASAAATTLGWCLSAQALPSGGAVQVGSATIVDGAAVTNVNQSSNRALITWDKFNVGSTETVNFNQPGTSSITFNVVNPANFSTIAGQVNGQGGVWIFSPAGLLIGPTAQINVGSFVATSATVDFLDNCDCSPNPSGPPGSFVNDDTINLFGALNAVTVAAGAKVNAKAGFVMMESQNLTVNGAVTATDGIAYGLGESATINFSPGGSGPGTQVLNSLDLSGSAPSQSTMNHGGSSKAAWVGVYAPTNIPAGFEGVINLGGVAQASGIAPLSAQNGSVVLLGAPGDAGTYFGDVALKVDASAGTLSATNGGLTVSGSEVDLGATTVKGALTVNAMDAVTISGVVSVGGGAVLTADAGSTTINKNVTIGGDLDILGGGLAVADNVTVSAGGYVNAIVNDTISLGAGSTVRANSDGVIGSEDNDYVNFEATNIDGAPTSTIVGGKSDGTGKVNVGVYAYNGYLSVGNVSGDGVDIIATQQGNNLQAFSLLALPGGQVTVGGQVSGTDIYVYSDSNGIDLNGSLISTGNVTVDAYFDLNIAAGVKVQAASANAAAKAANLYSQNGDIVADATSLVLTGAAASAPAGAVRMQAWNNLTTGQVSGTQVQLLGWEDITVNGAVLATSSLAIDAPFSFSAPETITINANVTTAGDLDLTAINALSLGTNATVKAAGGLTGQAQAITLAAGSTLQSDSGGAGGHELYVEGGSIDAAPTSLLLAGPTANAPTSPVTVYADGGDLKVGKVAGTVVVLNARGPQGSGGSGSGSGGFNGGEGGSLFLTGDVLGTTSVSGFSDFGNVQVDAGVRSPGFVELDADQNITLGGAAVVNADTDGDGNGDVYMEAGLNFTAAKTSLVLGGKSATAPTGDVTLIADDNLTTGKVAGKNVLIEAFGDVTLTGAVYGSQSLEIDPTNIFIQADTTSGGSLSLAADNTIVVDPNVTVKAAGALSLVADNSITVGAGATVQADSAGAGGANELTLESHTITAAATSLLLAGPTSAGPTASVRIDADGGDLKVGKISGAGVFLNANAVSQGTGPLTGGDLYLQGDVNSTGGVDIQSDIGKVQVGANITAVDFIDIVAAQSLSFLDGVTASAGDGFTGQGASITIGKNAVLRANTDGAGGDFMSLFAGGDLTADPTSLIAGGSAGNGGTTGSVSLFAGNNMTTGQVKGLDVGIHAGNTITVGGAVLGANTVEIDPLAVAINANVTAGGDLIAFQHIGILSLEFHVDKLSRPLL